MKKILIIIGLMLCATAVVAQRACVTLVEKAMYAKYEGAFENTNFSATYWQRNATDNSDIEKRKYDLQKLVRGLAERLGTNLSSVTQLDYLKKEPPTKRSLGEIINEENSVRAKFYANEESAYYLQVQVNKAYLKKESAETMINSVAEEVYHAFQLSEIHKLRRNEKTKVKKETVEQWYKDFQSDVCELLIKRIGQLQKKEEQLRAGNLNQVERENLEIDIKLLKEELYGSKTIGRKGCLEERYSNLQIEKDAKGFGEVIEKVYKDVKSNGRKI
jgi:hypothetical protein